MTTSTRSECTAGTLLLQMLHMHWLVVAVVYKHIIAASACTVFAATMDELHVATEGMHGSWPCLQAVLWQKHAVHRVRC
jgi:hypothetical protein